MSQQLYRKEVYDDATGVLMEDRTDDYGEGTMPARNTLGAFLYGSVMKKNGEIESALTISNADYDTATEWFVATSKDSWLKFHFFLIKNWTYASTAYALNDVRQDLGIIYKCISAHTATLESDNPADNSDKWTAISYTDILASPTLLADVFYKLHNDIQDVTLSKKIVQLSDDVAYAAAENCRDTAGMDEFEKNMLFNDAMNVKFWADEPLKGAVILAYIQKRQASITLI